MVDRSDSAVPRAPRQGPQAGDGRGRASAVAIAGFGGLQHDQRDLARRVAPIVVEAGELLAEAWPQPLTLIVARHARPDADALARGVHLSLRVRLEVEPPGGRAVQPGVGCYDHERVTFAQV